jgi:hypothetical protein
MNWRYSSLKLQKIPSGVITKLPEKGVNIAPLYVNFRLARGIVKSDLQLPHACPYFRQSAWSNSASKRQIFMKFDICVLLNIYLMNSSFIKL